MTRNETRHRHQAASAFVHIGCWKSIERIEKRKMLHAYVYRSSATLRGTAKEMHIHHTLQLQSLTRED